MQIVTLNWNNLNINSGYLKNFRPFMSSFNKQSNQRYIFFFRFQNLAPTSITNPELFHMEPPLET